MNQPVAVGDYGIDGPPVVRLFALVGAALIILGTVLYYLLAPIIATIAIILLFLVVLVGIIFLANAVLMVWSSKVGKIRMREKLIDALALDGSETVLDIGCGRGLLLNAAARRLTSGKAIGIDLWQEADQSGNSPENTFANAKIEGVDGRVEIKTADMRELPFDDRSIDVVVASMAIHNVRDEEGRVKVIQEIDRVLKPNGKITLLDFQCTDEYLQTLHDLGWNEAQRSGLLFKMIPPVRIVSGIKPA